MTKIHTATAYSMWMLSCTSDYKAVYRENRVQQTQGLHVLTTRVHGVHMGWDEHTGISPQPRVD